MLIFSLGCRQQREVNVVSAGATNAELGSSDIGKTNAVSEPLSIPTNSMAGDHSSKTPISIWRSPDSTVEECVSAVNGLLTAETTIESAENLLGNDGALSHHFGPSFGSVDATKTGGVDFCLLEYDKPHGPVTLRFTREPGTTNQFRFERAYGGKAVTP